MQRSTASWFHIVTSMLHAAPADVRPLDPRRASRASEMLSKLSQVAKASTLLEAKKRSSVVISTGSNNRMQRSRASQFLMVTSMQHARPADTSDCVKTRLIYAYRAALAVFESIRSPLHINKFEAAYPTASIIFFTPNILITLLML